jgi:Spy/CpxP family protein refolding chaperone
MRKNIMKCAALCGLIPAIAFAEPGFMEGPLPGEDMPMESGPNHHPDDAPKHRPSPRERLMKMLGDLNLTEAQKGQIEALLNKDETEIRGKFKAERKAKAELRRLAFSTEYTDDKAKALLAKSLPMHEQFMLQKARLDNAVFKLLTPEQQQKLQQRPAHGEPPPDDKPQ